jgi:hypothetical protein
MECYHMRLLITRVLLAIKLPGEAGSSFLVPPRAAGGLLEGF